MKSVEIQIEYETKLYPYTSTATALIEYDEQEEVEITGVFISEDVPEPLFEDIKTLAKEQFYKERTV